MIDYMGNKRLGRVASAPGSRRAPVLPSPHAGCNQQRRQVPVCSNSKKQPCVQPQNFKTRKTENVPRNTRKLLICSWSDPPIWPL